VIVRRNQPDLYDWIASLFADPTFVTRTAADRGRHGDRKERRRLRSTTELCEYLDWPGVQQVIEIRRKTEQRDKTTEETRYAITSLPAAKAGPRRLLRLVRGHWAIENKLHYVRDVTFDEDRCTVRTGHAPQALAALRNFAIGVLHAARSDNIAAALRRNAARANIILRFVSQPPLIR
jgi:predicted transposase YbfD/YdcC